MSNALCKFSFLPHKTPEHSSDRQLVTTRAPLGAVLNLISYYVVGLPLGMALTFAGPKMGLKSFDSPKPFAQ
ncbi:BQ5605_C005g03603 [Microbotryum silenes-dioicae]|uniref:BQ5605_C005g03603 protein n=1 Tax=Microbotryum silenes-dioicae TaxID=796604 RepID=A0A2X0P6X9_9BASI|nr:BQ5605_C005g03603 [Microbotryum silenes-dioicae]